MSECVCVCPYLSASTEASWIQEGEDVERQNSGQDGGEVHRLLRYLEAQTAAQEPQLDHRTPGEEVLQNGLPLAVSPLVKLRQTTVTSFILIYGCSYLGYLQGDWTPSGRVQ